MKLATLAAVITNSPKPLKRKKAKPAKDPAGTSPNSPSPGSLPPPPALDDNPPPAPPCVSTPPCAEARKKRSSSPKPPTNRAGIQRWTKERLSASSTGNDIKNCTISSHDSDDSPPAPPRGNSPVRSEARKKRESSPKPPTNRSGIQRWTKERLSASSTGNDIKNCTISSHESDTEDDDEGKASAEIEKILGASRPKHIGEGLTSGLGYILQGAVGAAGIVILMPGVAAVEGKEKRGLVGGIIGGVGGMVGGVVHAANVMGGGLVTGVGQVVRGAVATPNAVIAPAKGKWWNANEGKWVLTNLAESNKWIQTQPEFDQDILGDNVLPEGERLTPPDTGTNDVEVETHETSEDKTEQENKEQDTESNQEKAEQERKCLKDTYYYDIMNLDPSVDSAMIKRRYYILARKYEPDRCGANSKAFEEFKEVTTAYTVLTNDMLREKYDRVGREALWKDETGEQELPPPAIDPFLLYAFLFGSEKFEDYFGILAAATSARVGKEEDSKISLSKARLLQKRRVTRLALKLADRLKVWAEDGNEELAERDWLEEIEYLNEASYGIELIHVIGKVYALAAAQFLGSIESGIGMPSISRWAKKQVITLKKTTKSTARKVKTVTGEMDKLTLSSTVATAMDHCEGDAELEDIAKKVLKNHLQSKVLKKLWTQTVVDITNTLHEAAQMVLHDQNVSSSVRKKRGKGLAVLGKHFQRAQSSVDVVPEQEGLEEVAFFAMLDTVWRQEAMTRAQCEAQSNETEVERLSLNSARDFHDSMNSQGSWHIDTMGI